MQPPEEANPDFSLVLLEQRALRARARSPIGSIASIGSIGAFGAFLSKVRPGRRSELAEVDDFHYLVAQGDAVEPLAVQKADD
jgi:hypothetical protein